MDVHILETLEQGSEEWLNIRKGRATASRFKDILTPLGKASKSAEKYMRELAIECVVDDPFRFEGNKYTEWGHEHEPHARDLFTERTGLDVEEVGFCISKANSYVGLSPDGLIRNESGEFVAGLEIKCPTIATHTEYLLTGELPSEYKLQVHGSMAVSGIEVWYFMSYFPHVNPLIIRVEADDFTEKVKEAVFLFADDYKKQRQTIINKLIG